VLTTGREPIEIAPRRTWERRGVRVFLTCALAMMAASSALATPERDRSWDALIAEAQRRGGSETRLDNSASYVFQRPNGEYVAFTHALTNGARAVCMISKDQNLVVCDDWDTGKLTYSWRADALSLWTHSDKPPDANAAQATPIDQLFGFLGEVLSGGAPMHGYWRNGTFGPHWVNRR
jgi:hypothetical protein